MSHWVTCVAQNSWALEYVLEHGQTTRGHRLKTISSSLDAHLWFIAPPLGVGSCEHLPHPCRDVGWLDLAQATTDAVNSLSQLPVLSRKHCLSLLSSITSGSCCPNRKKEDTQSLSQVWQLYLDPQEPQGRRRGLTPTGHPLTSTGTLWSTCVHTNKET